MFASESRAARARWALVAVFVSWMPVHASAQPAASFGIDMLLAIEGVGLGLLGVLDYSWLVVDVVDAHDAGRRRERAPACELAWSPDRFVEMWRAHT